MKRFFHLNTLLVALVSVAFGAMFASRLDLNPRSMALGSGTPPPVALTSDQALKTAQGLSDAFVQIAQHANPAVVNISTSAKQKVGGGQQFFFGSPGGKGQDDFWKWFFGDEDNPFGRQAPPPGKPQQEEGGERLTPRGQGSGFLVDPKGYILTNAHVVEGADLIEVKVTNGSGEDTYKAKLVGKDEKTDLAVIRIESDKSFPYLSLGDSTNLKVGEWVVAVGNPFGVGKTVTSGIVSAKERSIGYGPYDEYLQTDASINPGNSGGPLLNLRGEVVGVNAAIFTPSGGFVGIGFAIPSNLAGHIYQQLKTEGKVTRGWLGIYIGAVNKDAAQAMGLPGGAGVLVRQVLPNSPAQKAGFKDGDIILEYDGQKMNNEKDLLKRVADTPVGKAVKVVAWREGEKVNLSVTIARRDEEAIAKGENDGASGAGEVTSATRLGLGVEELTAEVAKEIGAEGQQGVVIGSVKVGGPAEAAGLVKGDLIKRVNQKPTPNVKTFLSVIGEKGKNSFLIEFTRRGHTDFTVIKVEK